MIEPGVVQRQIGGIIANVTVEEKHTDTLQITDHPVERGPNISDHAFKLPVELVITAGWSNSTDAAAGDPGYVDGIYQDLLDLQSSRQPVDIQTGRRLYENMLIRALALTTDAATSEAMIVTATCREVILVDTVVTTLPPAANQASPQQTAPVIDAGSAQLTPAPQANASALSQLFGD